MWLLVAAAAPLMVTPPLLCCRTGRAVRPGKGGSSSSYVLKTAEEYAADTRTPVVNSKKYFKHKRLQVRAKAGRGAQRAG